MFIYNSIQTRSNIINGKKRTKIQTVKINGSSGYKTVTIRNNKLGTKKSKKRLTKKEINCIKKCKFIPGLFSDCESCLS